MDDDQPGDGQVADEPALEAGDFSAWIVEMQAAIRGEGETDVPCAGCTACCTSSQFVHIGPDETDTLAHIPAELLFPAPRMPRGHVLLGYDERGHCPMLVDNGCSIYEHRPRTCRTYDCRIFPATGVKIDDESKVAIAARTRRWEFGFPALEDRVHRDALHAAAAFLREHEELFAASGGPPGETELAVVATSVQHLFVASDAATGERIVVDPGPDLVRFAMPPGTGRAIRGKPLDDRLTP